MARLRFLDLATGAAGSTVDATLSGSHNNSTTTLTFNAALTYKNGTAVPTLAGSDHFMLSILDAGGHVAEVVKVTAYTAAATTATVTRAQESTSAVSHASGAKVRNAATIEDFKGDNGFTQLRKTVDQNITNASFQAITWDSELVDTLEMHDNSTNNTRLTARVAGLYLFCTEICLYNSVTASRYVQFYLNGSALMGRVGYPAALSGETSLAHSRAIPMAAGDYVEVRVFQDSGGTIQAKSTLFSAEAGCEVTACIVGAV